jgi:predicted  nucleic acid-binding Zn-ribbon protein
MADNPQEPPKKAQPPLPTSGITGRLKAPTTKLPPPAQAGATGKVVVMLSSVAKPTNSQKILPPPVIPGGAPIVTGPMATPTKIAPPLMPTTGNVVRQPPPLPAKKQPMPVATPLPAEQRLSTTTFVKLPPKTSSPAFVSLVPKPTIVPDKNEPAKVAPPLLPPKLVEPARAPEPAKSDKKKTGIIKLNPAGTDKPAAAKPDSFIFDEIPEPAAPPVPEGWNKLHTGELPLPPGGLQDKDPFEQSRRIEPKPASPTPAAQDKPAAKPSGPPPLTQIAAKAEPTLNPAPVELPSAHPVQHAPPMMEKGHEEAPGKLAPPHLPDGNSSPAASLKMPEVGPLPKAPEMPKAPEFRKDEPKKDEPKKDVPAKPVEAKVTEHAPPPLPVAKDKDKSKLKKTGPIMLATTTRIPIPGVGDKPALRPAVLPSRMRTAAEIAAASAAATAAASAAATVDKPAEITAKAAPAAAPAAKIDAPKIESPAKPEPETKPKPEPAAKTELKSEPPKEVKKDEPKKDLPKIELPANKPLTEKEAIAASSAAAGAATVASVLAEKKKKAPPLPPTRAERAKKRQYRGVIAFWVLFPFVIGGLLFGILYFGRDTRVEGQVIPPQGMSVADEVWIVSDFTSLASGVADDVARERVPLQLAIQEAQDHVQRVQADIASREERIHLIQDNIQAAKDDINNVVKKSQTDSQSIYDNTGKQLDEEYNAKIAELKEVIAGRAASLKLQYNPDPAFPSPEVWANAYRLALYQTPAGVDGVKEHQWIADQMKAWRDFQKSMDDRYQQMRSQAADLKQANGPHIADVNAKIDDLNGRITATQQEEDPLKAELIQAQKDFADAQAAEAGLDQKYYGQLDALPAENISYHIPLRPDGRFTWIPDNPFGEGETRHLYWMFSRVIRADGRQYWALQQIAMEKDKTTLVTIPPGSYESTKQILRPTLSPDEVEQ